MCMAVCALLPLPAVPGSGMRCGRVCWGPGFGCAPPLLGEVLLGCACGCACAPLAPAPPGGLSVARGCASFAVGGVCPPPSPLVFSFLLCGVGRWLSRSWVSWSLSPHPFSSGPRCLLFVFFFLPAWCVSALFECPFFRWAAALGLVLPFLAGWSPGAPLGGPVFGAVWVGGLAASCGVGGWHGGCGPFLRPPPCFFFLGGGGLPIPPSALIPGLPHTLVGILCGFLVCCWWLRFARPCPGPMGRVGYVNVGLGAPSCRVRFWLCRVGGCARRLRVALG